MICCRKANIVFYSHLNLFDGQNHNFVETECNLYTVTMIKPDFKVSPCWECGISSFGNPLPSELYVPTFRNPPFRLHKSYCLHDLWRWNSAPKRRYIKLRSGGITQKKKYINNKVFCMSPRLCRNYLCRNYLCRNYLCRNYLCRNYLCRNYLCRNYLCRNLCSRSLWDLGFAQRCWWRRGRESDLFITTIIQRRW